MKGNHITLIAAAALLLLALTYHVGRKSVRCPMPDHAAIDSLRWVARAQEEQLVILAAERQRLQAVIDSAEAAPRPTIATRVANAYHRSITGPLSDRIKRLDAAPDSL